MKILADNNLSPRVSKILGNTFTDSEHVAAFGLDENTDDSQIWIFAKDKGYTILTKDTDFEAMSRLMGCPPKVIQLTCGNKSTEELIQILSNNLNSIRDFINDTENCLMYLQ